MKKPTLYIFSGLSGSGKSTLSRKLASYLKANYIRIDTIEQALKDICKLNSMYDEGYRLGHQIAEENLKLGNDVVADSVNPLDISRNDWVDLSSKAGGLYVNIEITCKDQKEHKLRVESRVTDVKNLKMPTWSEVQGREYHEWTMPRIVLDTSVGGIEGSFQELLRKLNL